MSARGSRSRWLPRAPDVVYVVVLIVAVTERLWRLTLIPPTLWVDEAWFALRARDVLRGVEFVPIQPPGLGVGDSPMQVYLSALGQLLGLPEPYAPRFVSALMGTLTIALLYPLLQAVWAPRQGERTARWMALVAVVFQAGFFAHLFASRMGNQYALAPALALLTLALWWRGTTGGAHPLWLVGCGVALGLSQYTYESNRMLPALLILLGALRWSLTSEGGRRRAVWQVALVLAAALVAVVPLLAVYGREPSLYVQHSRSVGQGTLHGGLMRVAGNVVRNYLRGLWGLSIRGDMMPGRNLAGRPLLGPFTSLFFWLGLGVALFSPRIGARCSRSSRLFLLWLGLMLVPAALADQAPAFNRMLVATPAMAAIAALGVHWIWQRATVAIAAGRWRRLRVALPGALALGLCLTHILTLRDYFVGWVQQPELFSALAFGPRTIAERLVAASDTDIAYFTPESDPYNRLVNDLLLAETSVRTVDGRFCLPLVDRPDRPVTYGIVTVSDHRSLPWLTQHYPMGQEIDHVIHPDGYAYAVLYQVPAGTPLPGPETSLRASFRDGPLLIGYDLVPPEARPGDVARLTLYWQAPDGPLDDLVSFVHVGKGRQSDPLVASHDGQICGRRYPASRWRSGEVILDQHEVVIAADAPPDVYDIALGIYRPSDRIRLEVEVADRLVQDARVFVGQLTVRR